jgi:hypothetical protein
MIGTGKPIKQKLKATYPPTYRFSSPGTRDSAMFDGAGLKSRIAENRLPVNLESNLYTALIDCFQGESMIQYTATSSTTLTTGWK